MKQTRIWSSSGLTGSQSTQRAEGIETWIRSEARELAESDDVINDIAARIKNRNVMRIIVFEEVAPRRLGF